MAHRYVNDREAAFFDAFLDTVVPGRPATTLAEADAMLASKPAKIRRLTRLFMLVARIIAFVRFWRSFARLDAPKRRRLLEWLQAAPIAKLRLGSWGLRSVAYVAY